MHLIAGPYPSQWGGHLRLFIGGALRALIVSVIAFFILRWGSANLPIALVALILFLGALHYGASLVLTFLGNGFVALTSWNAFGQENRANMLTMKRYERGTIDRRNLAVVPPQPPKAALSPPTTRPISLPREVIPVEEAQAADPIPEMVCDQDEDWAEYLTDEDDEDALPPRELYDDEQIREPRRTIQEQLSEYLRYYRQGLFQDAELHGRWLENRPEPANFSTGAGSHENVCVRTITKDDRESHAGHYLSQA